jgi:hypothetical protein
MSEGFDSLPVGRFFRPGFVFQSLSARCRVLTRPGVGRVRCRAGRIDLPASNLQNCWIPLMFPRSSLRAMFLQFAPMDDWDIITHAKTRQVAAKISPVTHPVQYRKDEANMGKKIYPPDVLYQAQGVLTAWNQIDESLAFGSLNTEALAVDITNAQSIDAEISRLETLLTDRRNQRGDI